MVNFISLPNPMISCVSNLIWFLGLSWSGNLGLCPDITSFCDRFRFLQLDPLCVFCRVDEKSHNHLFFSCPWTSLLWRMIKSWLYLHKRMATINSVICGLPSSRNNTASRMRRVSLGILIYLIWEERSKRVFDNSCNPVLFVFRRFQVLFYMILHFHE
jgi:hypothetical protein